jgi:hypothetical protein
MQPMILKKVKISLKKQVFFFKKLNSKHGAELNKLQFVKQSYIKTLRKTLRVSVFRMKLWWVSFIQDRCILRVTQVLDFNLCMHIYFSRTEYQHYRGNINKANATFIDPRNTVIPSGKLCKLIPAVHERQDSIWTD